MALLQNGETCLHAAAISGNPELVQVVLEASNDPQVTNFGGQTPLELLMMFINYGNITLTPNLVKVLNLLPISISEENNKKDILTFPNLPAEELQKLRKLVRIYCPFNFNHATKVSFKFLLQCDYKFVYVTSHDLK